MSTPAPPAFLCLRPTLHVCIITHSFAFVALYFFFFLFLGDRQDVRRAPRTMAEGVLRRLVNKHNHHDHHHHHHHQLLLQPVAWRSGRSFRILCFEIVNGLTPGLPREASKIVPRIFLEDSRPACWKTILRLSLEDS